MYAFLQLRKLVRLVLQQAQVPSTDWQLLIVLDQAALESPLTPMLLQQLGIATLVVITAAVLISLLVQWLLAPLLRVSQALEQIASGRGDLTRRIDIQSQVTGEVAQNTTAIKDVADELAEDANQSLAQAKDLHEQTGKLNGLMSAFILK